AQLHLLRFARCPSHHRFLQSIRKQCQPLVDVVVQFSGNPSSFFLLCLDQPATQFCKDCLRLLLVGYIDATTYIARESSVFKETRHPSIKHPSVFTIMTPQAVFHGKFLPRVESLCINLKVRPQVVGMHVLCPAFSKFLLHCSSRESEPLLVEIVAAF